MKSNVTYLGHDYMVYISKEGPVIHQTNVASGLKVNAKVSQSVP